MADSNGPELYETFERNFTDSKTLQHLPFVNQTYGYANCWYEGEDEDADMWKDFTDDIGIVIKTVIGRLKRRFASAPGHQYVERVQYRDIELGGEPVPIDWVQALLTKDKKWEDQR
jgi:hypothetical protein